MAEIKGVNILGTIVPYTTADLYATHDAKYGRGGWRAVQNRTERDNLKEDYLQEGMAVRVIDDDTTYIWTKVADESTQGWHMEWVSDSLKLHVTEGFVDVSTDGNLYDPTSGKIIDASKGDYYIYLDTDESHDNEWGRTGYVYDGSHWRALNGNVNAENVYFPQGVDRTETWGRKTAQADVSKEEAKGKNLKDLIEFYILKEQFPSSVVGHYTNDTAPSWAISYNSKPTEHSVYLDPSYSIPATSDAWYEAGTMFYVPELEYCPKITAQQGDTELTSGDKKAFTIGPSYIDGLNYGYWKNTLGATYGENDRIDDSSVKFNGVSVTKVGGGTYTPKQTSKDASVEYTYNNTNTSSYLEFVKSSKITHVDEDAVLSYSSGGDASVYTSARTFRLNNTTGDASIELLVVNGNSWSAEYTNNKIVKSDVIRVATNKSNPQIEDSGTTKDVSVAEKTVGSNETKKMYDTSTSCWIFKAKSTYPTYVLRCTDAKPTLEQSTFEYVAYSLNDFEEKFAEKSDFNFANGAASPFSKRKAGYTSDWATSKSFAVRVPKVFGKPSPKIWDANEWKPVADMIVDASIVNVDVNDNAKQVEYYEFQFNTLNGLDAKYKLAYQ